jgi:GNAT superfamily N-acetyltransferase
MSAALRPPTEDDVPVVVRLMSEHGPDPADAELVRRAWASPKLELERDVRLEDGAYALVSDLGEGRAGIDLRGNPSEAMLDWAERRAGEIGTRLLAGAWTTHESLVGALQERGFVFARHWRRMEIDLGLPTHAPEWPAGIAARAFQPGDERTFYGTYAESFEDSWEGVNMPYEVWAHRLLDTPSFAPDLWFLALDGDEPAGFAICHPHHVLEDLGWIRLLGVRRPWRSRGLGRALLMQAFEALRARGFARAGLGVDAESDTGANRLYESAGMHVRARFDVYEKAVG